MGCSALICRRVALVDPLLQVSFAWIDTLLLLGTELSDGQACDSHVIVSLGCMYCTSSLPTPVTVAYLCLMYRGSRVHISSVLSRSSSSYFNFFYPIQPRSRICLKPEHFSLTKSHVRPPFWRPDSRCYGRWRGSRKSLCNIFWIKRGQCCCQWPWRIVQRGGQVIQGVNIDPLLSSVVPARPMLTWNPTRIGRGCGGQRNHSCRRKVHCKLW